MRERAKGNPATYFSIMVSLLLMFAVGALSLGHHWMPPGELLHHLTEDSHSPMQQLLLQFRLPRILLAMLIGAAIGVAGVITQTVFRNDLAEPGILGLASGSQLAVSLLLLGAGNLTPWSVPFACLVGALGTVSLVVLLSAHHGQWASDRLLLTGVAVSAALGSLSLTLSLTIDRQVYAQTLAWSSGSLHKADWNYVAALSTGLFLLAPGVVMAAPILNVIRLGDEPAMVLGLPVTVCRLGLLALATALAAGGMAVGGTIVFLGLIAPHLGRQWTGCSHGVLIPAAGLMGALLMLIADTLGRWLLLPVELPAGILVSALGGVYFLFLLVQQRGGK